MLNRNESAHRGEVGAGGNNRGQRFHFHLHFTPFLKRLQSPIVAGGYVLREGLLLVAEILHHVESWLADKAIRLDGVLYIWDKWGIGS